jgi:predicted aspartyl protease
MPFDLCNNVIFLRVNVNNVKGSKPLAFILDTGASGTVIAQEAAKSLGLRGDGEVSVSASGGSTTSTSVKNVTIRLSKQAQIPDMSLSIINLKGLEPGLGRRVDGILGYELFQRFVVEIDYVAKTIHLHEPATFSPGRQAKVFPITLGEGTSEEGTPFLHARLNIRDLRDLRDLNEGLTLEGNFLIDIGASGALTLYSPFVQQHALLERVTDTKAISMGALLAGKPMGRVGRVLRLQWGDIAITRPVVNFSQDTQGDNATDAFAGLIGGEVWRRFQLTLDYSRKRLYLEPNKHLTEPCEFDMSGMSLRADGKDLAIFSVRTLIPDSPALEADVRVGDILTTINGKSTSKMRLEQIRQLFRQLGKTYVIGIKRGETAMQITLKTRRFV